MSVDTEWLVDFFRRQARLGFEEGDYTRTRNCCSELLRQLPKDREAWQLFGEAALASHDSVTAQRAFDSKAWRSITATARGKHLDQLDEGAQARWPLRVSPDQRTAVIVHPVQRESGLFRED